MPKFYKRLYHVSIALNQESIETYGVDPDFSKGKLRVSWYVNWKRLQWALLHVSARHCVPVNHLIVCTCYVPIGNTKCTRLHGVYFVYKSQPITHIRTANEFIERL